MVDFKELAAKRAESRIFYATTCGKLLSAYSNALSNERMRVHNETTDAVEQALIAEIKRLQEIEARHSLGRAMLDEQQ